MKYFILFIVILYLIYDNNVLDFFKEGMENNVIEISNISSTSYDQYNPNVETLVVNIENSFNKLNLRSFDNENLKKNLINDFENKVFFDDI